MKLVASLFLLAIATSFSQIKYKSCIQSGNAGHPVSSFTMQPVSSIIFNCNFNLLSHVCFYVLVLDNFRARCALPINARRTNENCSLIVI